MAQARGASPDVVDEKARKIASLLSYYQADDDQGSHDSGRLDDASPSGSPRPGSYTSPVRLPPGGNPVDINSSHFNAGSYLVRPLRESHLADLADRHTTLTNEIGSLDGDMQLLVYENYSKFISATDTIKAMKTNVESMDSRMQELQQLITSVGGLNSEVDSVLHERRLKIEQLNQVRALLAKLQSVFSLPIKMRSALDVGALHVAIAQHAQVAPVLRAYGHKGSFRKVAAEAAELAREVAERLKARMGEAPEEAGECLQMMQRLGEPTEHLQDDFLNSVQQRLGRLLGSAGQVLRARAVQERLLPRGAGDGSEPPPGAELFERDEEDDEEGDKGSLRLMARSMFAGYLKLIRRAFADLSAVRAAHAAGITPTGRLVSGDGALEPNSVGTDWGTAEVVAALRVVAADLPRLQAVMPELSPRDRASEVMENVVRYHMTACFSALEQRAAATLHALRDRADCGVGLGGGGPHGPCSPQLLEELASGGAALQGMLVSGLDALVGQMKAYEQEQWLLGSWRDVFSAAAQGQLQQLLLSLLSHLVGMAAVHVDQFPLPAASPSGTSAAAAAAAADAVASPAAARQTLPLPRSSGGFMRATGQQQEPGSPGLSAGVRPFISDAEVAVPSVAAAGPLPPPTGLLLLLAVLSRFLEQQLLPHVLDVMVQQFSSGGGGGISSEGHMGAVEEDRPPTFVAAKVARCVGSASRQLLAGYAEQHSRAMGLALRRGMDTVNWLRAREPRQARVVCKLVVAHAAELQRELRALMPTSPGAAAGSQGHTGLQGGNGGVGHHNRVPSGISQASGISRGGISSLERGVFRGQEKFTVQLRFDEEPVLTAVLCSALQSFVESIRLHSIGRAGLQQLQLDVHFMRPALLRLVSADDGGQAVAVSLDDVLRAASERCMSQPELLDPAVLHRIVRGGYGNRAPLGAGAAKGNRSQHRP